METSAYFISCDWGTTNLRLRLVETKSLKVLAQHQAPVGIKVLNEEFIKQRELNRETYFSCFLASQINKLPIDPIGVPVIAAGMITSNIGLIDLPYASLPFAASGDQLPVTLLQTASGLDLLLISGVKSEDGMMRGEEVQALGLEETLKTFSEATLILPGTHSKHIRYVSEVFTDFSTYMTGELFELLTMNSILKTSVQATSLNPQTQAIFEEGLSLGFTNGLTGSLFSVRAKEVLSQQSKELNYSYLSGILIGDELSHLKSYKEKIVLAASSPMFENYALALNYLFPQELLVLLDGEALEKAFLTGQRKLMGLYEKY